MVAFEVKNTFVHIEADVEEDSWPLRPPTKTAPGAILEGTFHLRCGTPTRADVVVQSPTLLESSVAVAECGSGVIGDTFVSESEEFGAEDPKKFHSDCRRRPLIERMLPGLRRFGRRASDKQQNIRENEEPDAHSGRSHQSSPDTSAVVVGSMGTMNTPSNEACGGQISPGDILEAGDCQPLASLGAQGHAFGRCIPCLMQVRWQAGKCGEACRFGSMCGRCHEPHTEEDLQRMQAKMRKEKKRNGATAAALLSAAFAQGHVAPTGSGASSVSHLRRV